MTGTTITEVDPTHERLEDAMKKYRRDGAKLAAMILVGEPIRLKKMTVGDFLLQIPYIKRKQAEEWLRRAGVSPWRLGRDLSYHERYLIAGQLARFAAS
jgi:hypothetical protein